jgi:hypothetical protein
MRYMQLLLHLQSIVKSLWDNFTDLIDCLGAKEIINFAELQIWNDCINKISELEAFEELIVTYKFGKVSKLIASRIIEVF